MLIVAPQPFFTDRGTPIATRHFLEALGELGHEADVLTYPMGQPLDLPRVRLIRIPNPLRVRTVPIGFSWRKCWLDLFLFRTLDQLLRENDYTCVCAIEEAAFIAAIVAPRRGVPIVYDMQSSLAEQMGQLSPLRNRISQSLLERLERWLVGRVDFVVTSAGLAERVRGMSEDIHVREWRYPAVNGDASPPRVEELRERLGIDDVDPVVLYSGSFKQYQGLMNLLDAMPGLLARVPHAVLLLVGAEEGPDDQEVRRLARRLPARSLRILERQPHETMPAYLKLADVVVSPRLYGGNLPLKVMEYMAAGRAIVATSIPAHRTVLDDGRALLVEPNADALAVGIASLLLDERRRKELGRSARQFAETHLGWVRFVHGVREVLEDVGVRAGAG
jgi:glycosyltransferase involved in cell wall biosynthesis